MSTPQEENLTSRAFGGLSWTVGARVLGLLAQLLYTAVMARLLTPELFGLVASAQVVLLAGQILAELGIGRALVQKEELSDTEIRAGFTASVLLGSLLTGLLILGAPLVGALFDDPDVVPVTRGLAFVLVATTLGVTAVSVLLRDLRFKAGALLELGAFVVGYLLVGIGSALAGAGVWSLVAAAVSKAALLSLGALLVARHPMRPLLAWRPVKRLYAFGSQVSLVAVVEYVSFAVPPTAIGRLQGQFALGQFNQGNKIVELPFINVSQALSDVLFPAVSKIKLDRDRVAGAYLTAMRVTSGLLLPTSAGVAVAAPELVGVLLGEQWAPAARILPLLAFHASVMMVTHYAAVICEALGVLRPKILIQTVSLLLLLVGFAAFGRADLLIVVGVMLATRVVRLGLYGQLMVRELPVTWRQQLRALLGSAAGAAVVAGAILLVSIGGRGVGVPSVVLLVAQMATGAVSLALSYFYGPLRGVRDDLVQRLVWAGFEEAGGMRARIVRVARIGQAESPLR